MKRYMFGLDVTHPEASARLLAQHGYDGVVLSGKDPAAFQAAKDAGLETWLCYGAFSLGDFDPALYGAVDALDQSAPWFGSSCPNAAEVADRNLQRALQAAEKCAPTGILVDGARFASFASTEGSASFFGCFCPRCMEKMVAMGINAPEVKAGIADLMRYLKNEPHASSIPRMRNALEAWQDFRGRCIKQYFDRFAVQAHAAGLDAGAFVFAPSLWWMVGQRPDGMGSLDLVAPMLYRAYPHSEGPACLNHEWAAFRELLSHGERSAEDVASLIFDLPLMGGEDPMKGFSPEHVADEVRAARAMLPKKVQLAPIVQAEDAALEEVVSGVMAAGADGCGEFQFAQKHF